MKQRTFFHKAHNILLFFALLSTISLLGCSKSSREIDPPQERWFVFARKMTDGERPRGGITEGKPVQLAKTASARWVALQAPNIDKKERDRRAILAMCGEFRTSFDFVETVGFEPDYKLAGPYQSWATELVFPLEEKSNFISLQHILVMYFIEDGTVSEPFVMKHWRQDWTYKPKSFHSYQGRGIWKRRQALPGEGTWLQEVFHVDDSPRYASLGDWFHHEQFSEWRGNTSLRPLPRREYSVRKDYDVLEGNNVHIILPTGWIHEQENYKRHLDSHKLIAKELGLNRYENIEGQDFSAAHQYWEKTAVYWKAVRETWSHIESENEHFQLQALKPSLIEKHFSFAAEIEAGSTNTDYSEQAKRFILGHLVLEKAFRSR